MKLPMAPAFALSVFAVAIIGLLLEKITLRQSKSKEILNLVMITVGASIFIKGLSMAIWGKNAMTLPPFSGEDPILVFGAAIMPRASGFFGITVAVVAILSTFFIKTRTGKAMRAVAASRRSALLAGIPVNRMIALSFFLSGALGAVAGIILTPITTISYDAGVMLGSKGFPPLFWGIWFHDRGRGRRASSRGPGIPRGRSGVFRIQGRLAFLILLIVLFFKPGGIFGKGALRRV